ncbi:MAG: carboxypeptidase regulatory-like domain-containing protein [Acidobacteria bacterium]|nr:carboxypeptidase regulatory-like domain-containing protein [Acidobacteriota bacterium]
MRLRSTLLLIAFAVCAYAQRDLATLVGTISDPSGAGIPSAKVAITDTATGLHYEMTTAAGGEYVRPALRPGTYDIEVQAAGFKKALRRGILLTAGDRTGVDFRLEVGEVSTSIEIAAQVPVLQTESTIVGASVDAKQVSELPLGGARVFTVLARLSPGVVPNEPGARDAVGGGFSANGVRSNGQNNFLLNGVDNNVNVIDFLNQTAFVVGPSVEAIGEMRVMTNGYNAEYGRGAGGVVNVTIKGGTNQLHGSLFEYLQNDKTNARRWENRAKRPVRQNQFGAAVGGPVIKNRTFWFADFQGTRVRSTGGSVNGLGTSAFFTVPTPLMKNGDFSELTGTNRSVTNSLGVSALEGTIYDPLTQATGRYANGTSGLIRIPFAGNRIPTSRFDPVSKKIIDLFPTPNTAVPAGFPQNNYFTTTSGSQDVNQADLRIDHRISDKDSIFGSISWSNLDQINGQPLPGALDATYFASNTAQTLARNAMLSYTRVWSPTFITETRIAFTRMVTSRTQALPDVDQFAAFGIGGFNPTGPLNGGLPSTTIDRYSGFGASDWLPSLEYNNVWDFIQNVAIQKGGHSIKFGGEFRPIQFPFFQFPSPHGNWTYNRTETSFPNGDGGLSNLTGDGYASFLVGRVSRGQMSTTNFISSTRQAWAFFAQDDWKVNSRLTVNYGVRYELFSPIGERFGRQSNYDHDRLTLFIPKGKDQDAALPPNFATQFPQVKVSRGEVGQYLVPWDKTSIGPRIGFAYSLTPKTVVRAGYGIFYGGEENQGGNPNRGEAAPFNVTVNLDRRPGIGVFDANDFFNGTRNGFPSNIFTLPAPISFRSVAQNFRNPLVHKWNVSVQREFAGGNAFELAYVGNHQAHQLHFSDPNASANDPRPNIDGNARRPYPNIGGVNLTSTFGFGNYAGLTAKWERRFSNGLQYLASYTWGHALATSGTTLSGSRGNGVKDPYNWSANYATAGWDIRHNFVASFLYDLPIGQGKALNLGSRAANFVLGDWQLNGILTLRTGNPFTLQTNNCVGSFSNCTPDLVSGRNPQAEPSGGRTPTQWFDTSGVTRPAPGTNGNLGLQSNHDPGMSFMDLSLFKGFRLTERYRLQFRAEAFNLTNTPQFGQPNNREGDPAFGRITGTQAGTERKMQFALRFMF